MQSQVERSRSRPPVLRRVGAGLVLLVAAALVIHFALGLIMTVFWIVVVVAAIAAVVWALKTI
ncbi:MAG: hypothetical protein WAL63_11180 [Solirubrobacteraceae bacterium]